ncbi:MAG: DUF1631 family protein [Burkholderiales bacterium]
MAVAHSHSSSQYQALYQSTVRDAAAGGSMLMGKLVAAARTDLQKREAACRDLRERDALANSAKQLRTWEGELCKRFPQALLDAFLNPDSARKAGTQSVEEVAFDELELMDEVQVQTSVILARTQQVALMAAEASLAELNTLICTTQGLGAVNPERNPLRPQVYVSALRSVVEQTQMPAAIQLDWLGAMSVTLGNELRNMYVQLCKTLVGRGVAAAGYTVTQTPTGAGIGRGVAQLAQPRPDASAVSQPVHAHPSGATQRIASPVGHAAHQTRAMAPTASGSNQTLLTLDKLRRLLAGELDAPERLSSKELFSQRFAQEFESGAGPVEPPQTDFDATVPAALEALTEMKQVDAVVQRLQQRHSAVALPVLEGDTSVEAIRANLRSHARGVGQALSLEVITMMVDNIAQDERLLPPVQQLIRRLEPALLQLALADPRLFTNKQHPARMLVQEIAHRSLAYLSVHAYGFEEFLRALDEAIAPLVNVRIADAEPFELVLDGLQNAWQRAAQASERSRAAAMIALQNAEQRNLLAEKIAGEIVAHPDAVQVPEVVIEFLCGPWAQVVAHARLAGASGVAAADKYQALISAMLWSTHPELSRKNTSKLTRLVPLLLATLRDGLESIHFPATKTSAFLEALMGFHQLAFRAAQKPPPGEAGARAAAVAAMRDKLLEEGNAWVAPEEARASNFMDLPDLPPESGEAAVVHDEGLTVADTDIEVVISALPLGSWVELRVNEQWVRTQLSWASPHGTLFLFTSAAGATQSMTRRTCDKLVAAGNLRVISSRPVVDGALNAVAQMAMRNSVNTQF